MTLAAQVGYGFAGTGGLLTPFGELHLHDGGDRRLRAGARFGAGGLNLELTGARRATAQGGLDSRVDLLGRVRF